jgi:cyanoexosortase B-associated protein
MVSTPRKWQRFSISKAVVLVFLLLLVGIGTVPGYINGNWRWLSPPQIQELKQLKALKQKGIEVANWKTSSQQMLEIGGRKWLSQELARQEQTPSSSTFNPDRAALLLLPQTQQKDHPQVEWMDIQGWQRWTADSFQTLQFAVPSSGNVAQSPGSSSKLPDATVHARFFRGWTQKQTFAVVQWYAFPTGGSPSPNNWFWADRLAQWQQRRVPWVAVSVFLPIEPLDDIEKYRAIVLSLAESVQQSLMNTAFQINS